MPLGFERLNERQKRPNELINFIKPLDGPDKPLSQDFLERVAAISYPIMKANHIAVMSLEEYPPNPEFVGRNFNAGEVIQLVLKTPGGGRGGTWLPFRHVQMVMMHELAHCKQMNHSGYFWKVRNGYAKELRELWERKYTGEGFWSRGQTLLSGQYTNDTVPDATFQPRSLCGGTFRSSRKRKRKAGNRDGEKRAERPRISYAERKQRRILKKFGAGGTVLGDTVAAVETEGLQRMGSGGGKSKGKPRVASSRRGRELRAAAALARFDKVKDSGDSVKEEEGSSDSGTSDTEDDGSSADLKPATDLNGRKLTDYKGFGLIKVCEGEQENDENVKQEMEELRDVDENGGTSAIPDSSKSRSTSDQKIKIEQDTFSENPSPSISSIDAIPEVAQQSNPKTSQVNLNGMNIRRSKVHAPPVKNECPACSLINDAGSIICCACSNVLDVTEVPDYWRCQSNTCDGGSFINPGDFTACGVCGATRS